VTYIYKYPRPAVTADCVVITQEAEPRVLLVKRGNEPIFDILRCRKLSNSNIGKLREILQLHGLDFKDFHTEK